MNKLKRVLAATSLTFKDMFVVGELKWLDIDPGRQMIGSFYPHNINDWENDVYISSSSSTMSTNTTTTTTTASSEPGSPTQKKRKLQPGSAELPISLD